MEHARAIWRGSADIVAVEHAFEDFVELEKERVRRLLWIVTGSHVIGLRYAFEHRDADTADARLSFEPALPDEP